jgi:hypothetical protein
MPKVPPYHCSFRAKPRFLTARQGNLSGTTVLLGVRKTAKYWLGFGLDGFFCVSGPEDETTLVLLCLLAKQAVRVQPGAGAAEGRYAPRANPRMVLHLPLDAGGAVRVEVRPGAFPLDPPAARISPKAG